MATGKCSLCFQGLVPFPPCLLGAQPWICNPWCGHGISLLVLWKGQMDRSPSPRPRGLCATPAPAFRRGTGTAGPLRSRPAAVGGEPGPRGAAGLAEHGKGEGLVTEHGGHLPVQAFSHCEPSATASVALRPLPVWHLSLCLCGPFPHPSPWCCCFLRSPHHCSGFSLDTPHLGAGPSLTPLAMVVVLPSRPSPWCWCFPQGGGAFLARGGFVAQLGKPHCPSISRCARGTVMVATVSWGGGYPELMGTTPWAQQDTAAAAELAADPLAGHSASGREPAGRRPCPVRQPSGSQGCSPISGSRLLSL